MHELRMPAGVLGRLIGHDPPRVVGEKNLRRNEGSARHAREVKPTIWNIRVLIETDDETVVTAKANAIIEILCPSAGVVDAEHTCNAPWFVVTSPLRQKKSKQWTSLLNR